VKLIFKKRNIILFVIIITLSITIVGCQSSEKDKTNINSGNNITKEKSSEFLMDTKVDMQVYGEKAQEVINNSFVRMREIENEMSKNIKKSEISKINNNAANQWVRVSKDTFKVIEKALEYARLTNGRFDPTIGPLVELWGIGTSEARIPSAGEIEKTKKLVNYKNLKLNKEDNSIKFEKENMKIDLGGIAKGYAADEVRNIVKNAGIGSAYVNLGGNVLVIGGKEDGTPWKIGIQDPREARGSVMASLEIRDKTVVTSGNYERYFRKDGVLYHHILNPETGKPSRNELLSVSIISKDSFEADVLSTSAFILGRKEAYDFIKHREGIEAIFVTKNNNVYLTPGLKGKVEILDSDFKLTEGD